MKRKLGALATVCLVLLSLAAVFLLLKRSVDDEAGRANEFEPRSLSLNSEPTERAYTSQKSGHRDKPLLGSHPLPRADQAEEWADQLQNEGERGAEALSDQLLSYLQQDEKTAITALSQLGERSIDYEIVSNILFDYFSETGRLGVLLDHFTILEENPTLATPLLEHVVVEEYQNDPIATQKWLLSNPQKSGSKNAVQGLGRHIGGEDEPAPHIAQFLAESNTPDYLQPFLTGAMSAWVRNDLTAAFEFLAQSIPTPDFDEALYNMVGPASELDPETAMEWAQQVSSPHFALPSQFEVARRWVEFDHKAYKGWLEEQPQETQDYLRASLQ